MPPRGKRGLHKGATDRKTCRNCRVIVPRGNTDRNLGETSLFPLGTLTLGSLGDEPWEIRTSFYLNKLDLYYIGFWAKYVLHKIT